MNNLTPIVSDTGPLKKLRVVVLLTTNAILKLIPIQNLTLRASAPLGLAFLKVNKNAQK
jgi:hypothetical protein